MPDHENPVFMRFFENPADGYNAAWSLVKSSENPDFHRFLWG
jgi:hypothetical protein